MVFTTLVGSLGVVMPFLKLWDTKQYRPLRIAVFLSMAFSSIVPVMHLILLNGLHVTFVFFRLAAVSVTMYILGVVVCKSALTTRTKFERSVLNLYHF